MRKESPVKIASARPKAKDTKTTSKSGARSSPRDSVTPPPGTVEAGKERSSVLATKLRLLRTRAGLTLQQLSRQSGISQSALSKIENGQLSPTYEKIMALANGLQIEVAELFAETRPGAPIGRRAITRKGQGVVHSSPQYDYELLCGDLSGKQFMPLFATVKAHSVQAFPSLPRHEGEEFVYVVQGEVLLHSEFYEPLKLAAGDSCYFDSSMGHAFVAGGNQDAQLLWVCSKTLLVENH